jgi:rhodanese-related sulfurtransferase
VTSFLLANWYLVLVALVSGALLVWPTVRGGVRAGGLSTNDAVMLINRQKGVVIDVSEPAEYAAGHVAGSRSVPLGTLEATKALPSNKALPLVVVCPTGSRATRAVAVLKKLGYQNVQALSGGTAAWRAANLPIEKSAA